MEKMINVPLDDKDIKRLKKQADENGRAMGREAAKMIKDSLGKDK